VCCAEIYQGQAMVVSLLNVVVFYALVMHTVLAAVLLADHPRHLLV